MLTVIEERFYNSAISFFNRHKTNSEKRREIATAVLPAIIARYTEGDADTCASMAVSYADALIKKLEEKGE